MEYFPILAYHKISPEKEFGLTTISPQIFERQINIILESGFTPITFEKLALKNKLPEKPIIISFDDGYESVYNHALPVLEKYNIQAVVYIIAGYIGEINNWESFSLQRKYRHLSKSQIRELSDLNFEIGSHGLSHPYLPALYKIELHDELDTSQKVIEDITGKAGIGYE